MTEKRKYEIAEIEASLQAAIAKAQAAGEDVTSFYELWCEIQAQKATEIENETQAEAQTEDLEMDELMAKFAENSFNLHEVLWGSICERITEDNIYPDIIELLFAVEIYEKRKETTKVEFIIDFIRIHYKMSKLAMDKLWVGCSDAERATYSKRIQPIFEEWQLMDIIGGVNMDLVALEQLMASYISNEEYEKCAIVKKALDKLK